MSHQLFLAFLFAIFLTPNHFSCSLSWTGLMQCLPGWPHQLHLLMVSFSGPLQLRHWPLSPRMGAEFLSSVGEYCSLFIESSSLGWPLRYCGRGKNAIDFYVVEGERGRVHWLAFVPKCGESGDNALTATGQCTFAVLWCVPFCWGSASRTKALSCFPFFQRSSIHSWVCFCAFAAVGLLASFGGTKELRISWANPFVDKKATPFSQCVRACHFAWIGGINFLRRYHFECIFVPFTFRSSSIARIDLNWWWMDACVWLGPASGGGREEKCVIDIGPWSALGKEGITDYYCPMTRRKL